MLQTIDDDRVISRFDDSIKKRARPRGSPSDRIEPGPDLG
mgnify:CR=1 FL=1